MPARCQAPCLRLRHGSFSFPRRGSCGHELTVASLNPPGSTVSCLSVYPSGYAGSRALPLTSAPLHRHGKRGAGEPSHIHLKLRGLPGRARPGEALCDSVALGCTPRGSSSSITQIGPQ